MRQQGQQTRPKKPPRLHAVSTKMQRCTTHRVFRSTDRASLDVIEAGVDAGALIASVDASRRSCHRDVVERRPHANPAPCRPPGTSSNATKCGRRCAKKDPVPLREGGMLRGCRAWGPSPTRAVRATWALSRNACTVAPGCRLQLQPDTVVPSRYTARAYSICHESSGFIRNRTEDENSILNIPIGL